MTGLSGRQLALPFAEEPYYSAADFISAPSNAAARTWLDRASDWPGGRLVLWGAEGCGKTHLLHRWAAGRGAAVLAAAALRGLPPPPSPAGVAIDDADLVGDEAALLHLLNAAADLRVPVLLAGRTPPARWELRLPDLASRLRAVVAVELEMPEEPLLRALLARLLSDRQLVVPEPVQEWLLLRLPRTPATLRSAVERMDRLALAAGRPVGRGLAAVVVASFEDEIGQEEIEREISASPPAPASPLAPGLL